MYGVVRLGALPLTETGCLVALSCLMNTRLVPNKQELVYLATIDEGGGSRVRWWPTGCHVRPETVRRVSSPAPTFPCHFRPTGPSLLPLDLCVSRAFPKAPSPKPLLLPRLCSSQARSVAASGCHTSYTHRTHNTTYELSGLYYSNYSDFSVRLQSSSSNHPCSIRATDSSNGAVPILTVSRADPFLDEAHGPGRSPLVRYLLNL